MCCFSAPFQEFTLKDLNVTFWEMCRLNIKQRQDAQAEVMFDRE